MSVGRDVIAKTCNVPESNVKCSNCIYSTWRGNNVYLCQFWGEQEIAGSEFCIFWKSLLKYGGAEET